VVRSHLGLGREGLSLEGHLKLTVLRPDGSVREERTGKNVITTAGFGVLAGALVWAGIQDQAANLGVTSPTTLTPLYGAVGDGAGTPAETDTALFSEISRQTVGAGASSPATSSIAAQATFLFYFPSPTVTWTVTEAGAFANATSDSGSGTMIDHWAFSPAVSVPTSDTVLLQVSLLLGP
jgi:hypothetical protein